MLQVVEKRGSRIQTRPIQPDPLVLASASPRRAELLVEAGYEFDIQPATVSEPWLATNDVQPESHAEAVAYFKARAVASSRPDATILGADTIVAIGDRQIGKPRDAEDARRILTRLSASRHRVITGVALIGPGNTRRMIRHAVTTLDMQRMTIDDIDAYIASGEWQDKAGAYAIQETADRFVTIVEGTFSNVVGMPLELLSVMMAEWMAQERLRSA